ncbi:NAD(P)/FAD-dependent oxidoreductase [Mucilaginibacter pallidiroseus]|uniref:Ferredoxin--NADP reductase n=1 Tax=Mucilaginibacter pallidiroseus TaxID=2599295 RepID=A0A563TYG3_9SPHI|nr:NAD(P)/FAD-dependent oxidoreductase [Mucilaginibacter pallidiroseus]TWR24394.1 NAD(P)/FAD-dependent oxidoreductase [Mucilaginibacter pallidiroseus]
MISSDICIIGAGPVGLFAVFETGLLKMRCHVVDVLPQVGGQLTEIYPGKPIYDIPGYPKITGEELVGQLMTQIAPFKPSFTLGERVEQVSRQRDETFLLTTSAGTVISARVVVIAGGLGCFEPRKPVIPDLNLYEGNGVAYSVRDPEVFRGHKVVIAGGGDSALDWTLVLAGIADKVTLVHRGNTFRGAPDTASRVQELANAGKLDLIIRAHTTHLTGKGKLNGVGVSLHGGDSLIIPADDFIPLFGLTPRLGPIAEWGLNMDKDAINVNTIDYSTSEERIYAIGDINHYPGKLKLILCGFHEAALMARSAFRFVYPDQRINFKYTTVYGINAF